MKTAKWPRTRLQSGPFGFLTAQLREPRFVQHVDVSLPARQTLGRSADEAFRLPDRAVHARVAANGRENLFPTHPGSRRSRGWSFEAVRPADCDRSNRQSLCDRW